MSLCGSYGSFFKGINQEFETAVLNELSVFEPLKLYCTWVLSFLKGDLVQKIVFTFIYETFY